MAITSLEPRHLVQHVQVRVADVGACDLDEHLPGARFGNGDVVDLGGLALLDEAHRSHGGLLAGPV